MDLKGKVKNIVEKNSYIKSVVYFILGEILNKDIPLRIKVMRMTTRSVFARKCALFIHTKLLRKKSIVKANSQTVFETIDVNAAVKSIRGKSFWAGLQLPQSLLSELLEFCDKEAKFRINMSESNLTSIPAYSDCVSRPDGTHFSCRNPHEYCEAARQVCYDPKVIEIFGNYFGSEPMLQGTIIWWSYPLHHNGVSFGNSEWGYHYDIDDYKFAKLFFYLTDVDRDCGPHVLVEGTHKSKNVYEKLNRRMSDEEVESRYPGRIRIMTGKKGSGFFSDTFNIHKGLEPKKRRCIFQIVYSITNIQQERRK